MCYQICRTYLCQWASVHPTRRQKVLLRLLSTAMHVTYWKLLDCLGIYNHILMYIKWTDLHPHNQARKHYYFSSMDTSPPKCWQELWIESFNYFPVFIIRAMGQWNYNMLVWNKSYFYPIVLQIFTVLGWQHWWWDNKTCRWRLWRTELRANPVGFLTGGRENSRRC